MRPRFLTATLRAALARVNDEFSPTLTRIPRATKFYDPLAFPPAVVRRPRGRMGRLFGGYELYKGSISAPFRSVIFRNRALPPYSVCSDAPS